MPAQPRLYRYDDVGAPQPTNAYDAFYQVAKAVLVDGYGSQLAAGWSMVYDQWTTQGHAQFTNAGQSGVLGLVKDTATDPLNFTCSVFIADGMIDATNAVNARSGIKAVSNISTLTSLSNRGGFTGTDTYRYWAAIANEQFAIFWFGQQASYLFTNRTDVYYYLVQVLAVGALRSLRGMGSLANPNPGNFACIGGLYNGYRGAEWGSTTMARQLRDRDGAIATTDQYGGLLPYAGGDWVFGRDTVDSMVDMRLQPAEVWIGQNTSYTAYFSQTATAPMLLSNSFLSHGGNPSANSYTRRFSPDLLTTPVNIGGKLCLVAPLPENKRIIVSLQLEDWQ